MSDREDPPPVSLDLDPDLLDWDVGPPKRRGQVMSISEYREYRSGPRRVDVRPG